MAGPDEEPDHGLIQAPAPTSGDSGTRAERLRAERGWLALIISSTAAVLLFSVYCLSHGITIIFMHLFYFPIVLLAYRYRYRGFAAAVFLSLTYVALVYFYDPGQSDVITGAWYRFLMFVGIAAMVAYVSEQLTCSQEATRESEEKYRAFFTTSIDCVFITTRDGRWVDFNDAAVGFFGYGSRRELAGIKIDDLYADPAERAKHIRFISEKGYSFEYPVDLRKKDGTIIHTLITSVPRRDGTRTIIGFQGTIRDITGQQRAEESIRKSFALLRGVVESPKDVVIFALDRQYRYIAFNENHKRTMKQIWGTEIALGNSMLDYIGSPEDREKAAINFDRALAGESFTIVEAYGDTALERRWYEDIYNPVRDENGNVIGLTLFLTDITERKTAEKEVFKAQQGILEHDRFLQRLIDTIPNPIFYKDKNGIYTGCNTAFEGYIGLSKDQIVGKSVYDISPKDLADTYYVNDRKLLDNPGTQIYESRVKYADGSIHDVIFNKATFTDLKGNVEGLVGVILDITMRKTAEEALRLQNQIFGTIAEGVYLIRTRDGVIVYTNTKFDTMFGYEQGELIGKHVSVVNAPEGGKDPQETAEEIMKALNEKGKWRGEVKNIRKDGTTFWCLAAVSTFEHPEFGSVWISAHTDITASKQAEEALGRSYAVLKGVVESPKEVVIFALDRQYRYIAFNENHRHTMQQIWGVDIVLGNSMTEYIRSPDDRKKAIINFDRALSGESFTLVEAYGDTALERKWYENTYNPITDENGNVIGLTLFLTDITNRKQMEEALRESEEKFRGVAERSSDIIMLTDEKGRTTYFAPSVEKILGYMPDEITGTLPGDLIHPDDLDSVYELVRKNVEGKVSSELLVIRIRKKDGSYAIMELFGSPIIKNGIFSGMQVIGRDITARKQAEEEREKIRSWQVGVNRILESVLAPTPLDQKLKIITDGVVETFGADFCRIWLIEKGDLCSAGCMHAEVAEGPHACRYRDKCLRLKASSGRYTHIDGKAHRRVPFGAYKIGRIASGEETKFLTNDVVHDPQVHDHEWAQSLGLVAFSGYRLKPPDSDVLGVFALFARFPITPDMDTILEGLSRAISIAIQKDIVDKALQESEERVRTIFEQSPLSIEVMSPDGRTLQVNHAFEELWGVKLEDLKDYSMLKDEQLTRLGIMPSIQRGFSGETVAFPPVQYDGIKTLGIGKKKWVQGNIYPVRDAAGTIRNVILVHQDITEQRKAEEALRESEQRFRDIFNNITDAILLHEIGDNGLPGRFTDVNDVACRMLGYTREEMFAKTPLDITTDYHNPSLEKIFEEQRTVGTARFETEYRVKDGTIIPVEVNTHVVTILGKKLMLGDVRDITERKRAEAAILQSEQKFRDIFDNANDAIEIIEFTDTELPGWYLDVNTIACRMLQYTKEELLRISPMDVDTHHYNIPFTVILQELQTTGHVTFETGHRRKDGVVIPVEINSHKITLLGIPVLLSIVRDITERKKAEEALKESEYRFRELFNSMSSGVAVYRAVDDGADFEFVDFNHGAEVIEKTRKQDVIGRRVTEAFPGIGAFGLLDVFRRVWQTGMPEHHPTSMYRDERIASWRENFVYRLPSGEVVAIYDDVTARRQAEEALLNSEARIRTLVQTIPDLIWLKDTEGVYLSCNSTFERFFGAKESEIVGKTDYDFVDRELADFFREHDRIAMAAGRPSSNEEWITFADDGHRVLLETIKTPMYGKDGGLIGVLGIGRDITERRKAQDALQESEQKFRDIFNNTTDAIHIHGINDDGTPGRFTDINDVACRMLGYTKEEMLAKTPLDITTDYHNPPVEIVVEEQRTTGSARFETEHRAKDGTIIPVEVNTRVVTIQGTKVMLGVVRDITERKKAEALLRDFNKELEQQVKAQTEKITASLNEKVLLLREIHHRVKNNLQIIISLVNLQMRQIDDERLKQVMAETQNRVRAMSFVHEKLYQSETISHIDLASYTRFLVTQLFSFYGVDSRQVRLNIDIGKIMVGINTAIPLGLIINELASNTLKHAFPNGRKGTLSMTIGEEGKTLHLTIQDDGIGIPADFDWRNAESLGLRLVVSLVEQLDGTIELDRSAGTVFTIVVTEKD